MTTGNKDELQRAADAGELRNDARKVMVDLARQYANRRWAVERGIAFAQTTTLSPDAFKNLVEWISAFAEGADETGATPIA